MRYQYVAEKFPTTALPDRESESPTIRENGRARENDQLCGLITDKDNKQVLSCENCGKSFEPATENGGRPQKFCSRACRRAFHGRDASNKNPKHSQRPAPNVPTPTSDTWQPAPQIEDTDFDWDKDENSIVLEGQERSAVYFNGSGGLVIRQDGWLDDDVFIVISKNNIPEFLHKLTDAWGIPLFP